MKIIKFLIMPINQLYSDITNRDNWKQFFIFLLIVCGISSATGLNIDRVMALIIGIIALLTLMTLLFYWIFREKE